MNDLAKKTPKTIDLQSKFEENSPFLANFCLLKGTSGTRGLEFRARAFSGFANLPIFRAWAYRAWVPKFGLSGFSGLDPTLVHIVSVLIPHVFGKVELQMSNVGK